MLQWKGVVEKILSSSIKSLRRMKHRLQTVYKCSCRKLLHRLASGKLCRERLCCLVGALRVGVEFRVGRITFSLLMICKVLVYQNIGKY